MSANNDCAGPSRDSSIKHHHGGEYGYGACRSAALSAFLKVGNRHFFFVFMRDAIVQLCCVFYKAVLTDPIGSSQELTLRATIAKLGSVSSRQLLFHVHLINFLEEGVRGMYDFT